MTDRRNVRRLRAALIVLVAALMVIPACDTRDPRTEAQPAPTPSSPPIKQAKWHIKTYASGVPNGLSKKQKKHIRAQKAAVSRYVKRLYNDLFLGGGNYNVVRDDFTSRAAAALRRTGALISDRLSEVKTTTRRASIGIGPKSARQAAVEVWVRARARAGEDVVRIVHRSTLWLQKESGRWKAIAFEIKQGPAA